MADENPEDDVRVSKTHQCSFKFITIQMLKHFLGAPI